MLFGGEVEPSDVSKGSEDTRLGRGQLTQNRRFAIIPTVRGLSAEASITRARQGELPKAVATGVPSLRSKALAR